MNTKLLVGIALACLATAIDIVSTALPYWLVLEGGHVGLFHGCIGNDCQSIKNEDPLLKATRALMILSIVSMAAAVLFSFLFGSAMTEHILLASVAAILTFLGAAFAVAGIIIYGVKTHKIDLTKNLHAGFGLAIAAAIIEISAGVLFLISKQRNAYVKF